MRSLTAKSLIKVSGLFLSLALLSACALLMPPNPYTKELVKALAEDDASACVRVNLAGGGMGVVAGPGVIPAGGYGNIGLTMGRTGQDKMQIYVGADGSCQVRSMDKDFVTPTAPAQTLTMQGLGTGALVPTPGTAVAPEKKVETKGTPDAISPAAAPAAHP